jgi:hypothetical protein
VEEVEGETRRQHDLGDVEDELHGPLAAVDRERQGCADELREQEPDRREVEDPEHGHDLVEGERVCLAAVVNVDDPGLGRVRERREDEEPRQELAGHHAFPGQQDPGPDEDRAGDERPDVEPDQAEARWPPAQAGRNRRNRHIPSLIDISQRLLYASEGSGTSGAGARSRRT